MQTHFLNLTTGTGEKQQRTGISEHTQHHSLLSQYLSPNEKRRLHEELVCSAEGIRVNGEHLTVYPRDRGRRSFRGRTRDLLRPKVELS